MWLLWIIFALLTCGIILLIIPLVTNTTVFTKPQEYAVCQNCGNVWDITPRPPLKPQLLKIALAIVAFIVLLIIFANACGSNNNRSATDGNSVQPTSTTVHLSPQLATPSYTVLGETDKERKDKKPTYFVVINPVDLSNDGFKQNVELVLQDLAKTNGGPDFSASVFDDEDVANTQFHNRTTFPRLTPNEIKAQQAAKETHLIAMYTGGINDSAQVTTADDAYTIGWFPAAFTDNAAVGKYVKLSEQWKP